MRRHFEAGHIPRRRRLPTGGNGTVHAAAPDGSVERLPRNPGLLFLRGSARERLGQFNDALADYPAAIEEGPNATYSAARAELLRRLGREPKAR
jgi:tetratricopeptide (TPR) repeat protein